MSDTQYSAEVSTLDGQSLDYWMYQHATRELSRSPSTQEFEAGYAKGLYRFSTDKALVVDLMLKYSIRLQMIGAEWLASTEKGGQFGHSPNIAACRLVVAQAFGKNPSL